MRMYDSKNDERERIEIDGDDFTDLFSLFEGMGSSFATCFGGYIGGIIGGTAGTIGGGFISYGSNLILGALAGGCLSFFAGAIGGAGLFYLDTNYSPGQKIFSDKFTSRINQQDGNTIDEIKEEIQKFVYFKDNKIVGFIKFKKDITPPVNGYYFKCEFNMKIVIGIPGIILTNNQVIKNAIDFYDGEKYIKNMKKLFSLNS